MRMSEVFPSNYLKADDLEEGDMIVTIRDEFPVENMEFTKKGSPVPESKPVLYFKSPRDAKPLVLNKTNWKTISQVLGTDESDDWAGQTLALYATEVESFGEMTMAIRVRLKKPQPKTKAATAAGQSQQRRSEPEDPYGEDITPEFN